MAAPESGAVMVRGRAGAVGAPFDLDEMTAARCAVRLEDGAVGHLLVQGRDKEKAPARRPCAMRRCKGREAGRLEDAILAPLRTEVAARARAERAAATKVEFFTMVRGEVE